MEGAIVLSGAGITESLILPWSLLYFLAFPCQPYITYHQRPSMQVDMRERIIAVIKDKKCKADLCPSTHVVLRCCCSLDRDHLLYSHSHSKCHQ